MTQPLLHLFPLLFSHLMLATAHHETNQYHINKTSVRNYEDRRERDVFTFDGIVTLILNDKLMHFLQKMMATSLIARTRAGGPLVWQQEAAAPSPDGCSTPATSRGQPGHTTGPGHNLGPDVTRHTEPTRGRPASGGQWERRVPWAVAVVEVVRSPWNLMSCRPEAVLSPGLASRPGSSPQSCLVENQYRSAQQVDIVFVLIYDNLEFYIWQTKVY